MKLLFSFLSLTLATSAMAAPKVPHMDLQMTSREYRKILSKSQLKTSEPMVERAIALGDRLSKWIAKVNSGRTPTTAIRLTSATTRIGIPIDKPNVYNPELIGKKTDEVLAGMPASMREVILGKGELPGTIPVDDETFIKHGRLLDRNYQQGARYKSLDGWRSAYIQRAAQDVRGYYYLNKNKITAHELRDVNLIPEAQRPLIKDALLKICANNGAFNCAGSVDNAFRDNKLADVYNRNIARAKKIWDDFFVIPSYAARGDAKWSGNEMVVPFNTPTIAKFGPYLKDNIEDEFRWNGWGLKLNFGSFPSGPRLTFQPGVVPHVNGLGGNEIVMDSNQPIEEYESQWTIRHEFGHVIGLPDCYHEFYDTALKAYVNYQLDTTDLMCSRAGNMNERIYLQLKKSYGGRRR